MKKLLLTACGALFAFAPLFTFANLTASQQVSVDTAATKIVMIMEKQNISMSQFIDLLGTFETKLEGNDTKLMVLDALRNSTLDAYYEVENFAMCESYSDGCNTCMIMDNYEIACTKMACVWEGIPECLQYEGDDNDQELISMQGMECKNAGGQFNTVHNECEGIDGLACNSLGGTFDECASACRHQPEGSICTMQCVQVCNFNGGGNEQEMIDAQMDLDAAMSQWESQDKNSYTLTQTLSCFCTEEYRRPIMFNVSNGVITSDGVYADGDQEMIDPETTPDLMAVEGAFALIQDAIDQQAPSITVDYDETLGYPMSISIDYNAMMADEEKYYTFQLQ